MPIRFNEGFSIKAPFPIDDRLIVDRVAGTTASLEALIPQYNYRNMIVWVREDKAFYYLRDNPDSPSNPGITFSDWILFSGGGGATTSCTKSGYITGDSFTTNGTIATASVTFQVPYLYASYSVAVTGLTNYDITGQYDDYVYSVFNRSATGFDIQVNVGAIPLGATAMWIASCFEGSNDIAPGGFGAQGPTGPGGGSAIDLEEIAYGTGTGITSSSTFTFDVANTSLIFGNDHTITNAISSAIIAGTHSRITSATIGYFVESNIILASTLACINCSDFSNIQNTNCGQIWNSTQSVIINSSFGPYGSKICNSNNSAIVNSPRSYINNKSGSYENFSRQFIIGGYLHTICQKEGAGPGNGYNGGSGILGGAGNCICVGGVHSVILSGRLNSIKNLNFFDPTDTSTNNQKFSGGRSAILAGERNTLTGPKIDGSVIIGGCTNSITSGTIFSTIVGGYRNTIATSSNSAIIGGICNWMTASDTGSIMFSKNSSIDDGSFGYSELSSIFLSNNSKITLSCKAVIISSNDSNISGSIHSLASSIIFGGFDNSIGVGNNSMILGGQSNYICCVNSAINTGGNSFIIGGRQNAICGPGSPKPSYSSIIGGFTNSITGRYATIINSCKSLITCINCFNTIISSVGSTISFQPGSFPLPAIASQNSLIVGGSGNKICGAVNSAIIGGQNIVLYGTPAINITGVNNRFDNVVAVPSLIGHGSLALSVGTTSTNILLNNCHFTMLAYPPDPGSIDVCLPSANAQGRIYIIKKSGSSTQSTVKVCPYFSVGSECIDGYAGYVELINPWDYYMLQADGVDNWIKLGGAVGLNL